MAVVNLVRRLFKEGLDPAIRRLGDNRVGWSSRPAAKRAPLVEGYCPGPRAQGIQAQRLVGDFQPCALPPRPLSFWVPCGSGLPWECLWK